MDNIKIAEELVKIAKELQGTDVKNLMKDFNSMSKTLKDSVKNDSNQVYGEAEYLIGVLKKIMKEYK